MLAVWRQGHPLWAAPHRPFFAAAALWALLVPFIWFLPSGLGPEPVSWHSHEMLFGMGAAAMGGYLLTALPAWTGAGPVSPRVTRLLAALWLAGRFGSVIDPPPPVALGTEAGYFVALGAFLSRQVVVAGAWHRMPLAMAPFILGALQLPALPESGLSDVQVIRIVPLFYALLISIVGGRLVAAFTAHWVQRHGATAALVDRRWISQAAVLSLIVAIALQLIGAEPAAGALMILSGLLQFARMLTWRSWQCRRYPALLMLHLAWLWLASGLALVGFSLMSSAGPDTTSALHALTMGAMGTMMVAIMGRPAMKRCGGRLLVSAEFSFAFAFVCLSAVARICASLVEGDARPLLLQLAALLWIAGWLLFLHDFRHALRGPVERPVLSARIGDQA